MNDFYADVKTHELDELLTLAESSTATLDRLDEVLDRIRAQTMGAVFAGYIALGLSGYGLIKGVSMEKGALETFVVYAAATAGIAVFCAMFYGAYSRVRSRQRIIRERRVERDVHEHLISLIDQQIQRVMYTSNLSPIALATIQIRLKRLAREWSRGGMPYGIERALRDPP